MIRQDYTFNASAKTITFTNPISLSKLGAIFNVTAGILIFNVSDPTANGSLTGNVLTLTYNTTTMNNTDTLQIFYSSDGDDTVLQSITINSIGIKTAIDTTGYHELVLQASYDFSGNVIVEVSNDGSNWDTTMVFNRLEPNLTDCITDQGTYTIYRSGNYLRLNVLAVSISGTFNIIGRVRMTSFTPVDTLALAMNEANNSPLQVALPKNYIKQDINGGLVLADQVSYVFSSASANSPMIVDTTGYNSVVFQQTTAGIVIPTISNDGANWVAVNGYLTSAINTLITTTAAAGITVWPVLARFMKLTGPATVVSGIITLRQAQFYTPTSANTAINAAQISGTAAVTAGVSGMLAVGGNIAAGTAPTANPVLIAGVDTNTTPLTRRLLTDTTGRLLETISAAGQDGVIRNLQINLAPNSGNSIQTTETARYEDATLLEIQSQILLELRILNHQMFELPKLLNAGQNATDEPDAFRTDPQGFKI